MKNKYKNNADAIKYLSALCDKEVQKPVEEMDCELIASTVELLLKLQGKKVSLTEKEIEEKVRKIPFTESSDNVKEFKVNKNVRTKTTQKRILLIAAVIAILVAILSFVSVAYEWDIFHELKERFGTVANTPAGVVQEENGITFQRVDDVKTYDTIEELVEKEKLDILLPDTQSKYRIKTIYLQNTTKNETISVAFKQEDLYLDIEFNTSIPKPIISNKDLEVYNINNIKCYIESLDDVGLVQICFSYQGNFYKFTYSDKQVILDIIKNLEETK